MTTFRTTARISLAAVALVFGATFAAAKDKTPAKPPVAYQSGGHGGSNVQGHKLDEAKKPSNFSWGLTGGYKDSAKIAPEAKKPSNFSWGMSQQGGVKDAAKIAPEAKKPNGFTYQKIESVKSPRDAASGQATGKTNPPMVNK